MQGRIIAVVGAPRTGKSYLVKKLADHYGAQALYEGEGDDFPERIKEDIAKNIRPLERVLWFRNKLTGQYREAIEIKKSGGTVITDLAYFAVDPYVDVLTEDSFEREILHTLARSDEETLGMPDKIIHLISNEQKIKEFIQLGGREFDTGENYYTEHVLPVEKVWREYLSTRVDKSIVVEVNRADLDFEKQSDFQDLLKRIAI